MKIKPLKSKEILVIETDLLSVRCSIVERGETPVVKNIAEVFNFDMEEALSLCLAEFKQSSTKVPKNAVLVTAEAVPAFVKVPLDEKAPHTQTMDMIRWEMNDELEAFSMAPHLEAMLISQGQFSPAIHAKVEEHSLVYGGITPPPFIDVAIELDILKEDDRDVYEEKQDSWLLVSEDYTCNWLDVEGGNYLVAYMENQRRSFWREQLYERGIKLHSIIPQATAGLSTIKTESPRIVFMAATPGMITTIATYRGKISSLEATEFSQELLPEGLLNDLATEKFEELYPAGTILDRNAILNLLETQFPAGLEKVTIKDNELISRRSTIGAALSAWSSGNQLQSVMIPPVNKIQSVIKDPTSWWTAAAFIWVIMLYINIFSPHIQLNSLNKELTEYKEERKKARKNRQITTTINKEFKRREIVLQTLDGNFIRLSEQVVFLKNSYPENNDYILDTFSSLITSSTNSISLGSISIEYPIALKISGIASSERSIQMFKSAIQKTVYPYNYRSVKYSSKHNEKGTGYHFNCSFINNGAKK